MVVGFPIEEVWQEMFEMWSLRDKPSPSPNLSSHPHRSTLPDLPSPQSGYWNRRPGPRAVVRDPSCTSRLTNLCAASTLALGKENRSATADQGQGA